MVFLVVAVLLALAVWVIFTRRRLRDLSENVDIALNQIGLQLSSLFRAVAALQKLAENHGILTLPEPKAPAVDACSAPIHVLEQEQHLSDAMRSLSAAAESCPALAADPAWGKCMEAARCYGRMVRTSSLIYNDSVSRFNHTLERPLTRVIAGRLGFAPREYLSFTPDTWPLPAPGPHTQAS